MPFGFWKLRGRDIPFVPTEDSDSRSALFCLERKEPSFDGGSGGSLTGTLGPIQEGEKGGASGFGGRAEGLALLKSPPICWGGSVGLLKRYVLSESPESPIC